MQGKRRRFKRVYEYLKEHPIVNIGGTANGSRAVSIIPFPPRPETDEQRDRFGTDDGGEKSGIRVFAVSGSSEGGDLSC